MRRLSLVGSLLCLALAASGRAEPIVRVVAAEGEEPLGTPEIVYDRFGDEPFVDAEGRIAFDARLTQNDPGIGREPTFVVDESGTTHLALTDEGSVEGLGPGARRFGTRAQGFTGGYLLATANVAPATGPSAPALVLQRPDGGVELVMDAMPFGPGGFVVEEFLQPVLKPNGLVASRAFLEGIGFPTNNGALLGSDGAGGIVLHAQVQQPPPDAQVDGVLLGSMGDFRMNRAGEIAFPGIASFGFIPFPGIYGPAEDGHLTRIVWLAQEAVGAPPGTVFTTFGEVHLTNPRGTSSSKADAAKSAASGIGRETACSRRSRRPAGPRPSRSREAGRSTRFSGTSPPTTRGRSCSRRTTTVRRARISRSGAPARGASWSCS